MSVRVRLFAALREIAGSTELLVDAPDVGSLCDQLSDRFGAQFGRILAAGSVVRDGEVVGRRDVLNDEDEVALLPPVSGGARNVSPDRPVAGS